MPAVATTTTTTGGGGEPAAELAALEAGGAWGAVYNALKGPCMARAVELQSGAKGKRGAGGGVVSTDLATCLDNMARCAEVSTPAENTGDGSMVVQMPKRASKRGGGGGSPF